jgi:C4-dicarboxylate-specific signal transduction histidine kinase
MQSDFVHMNRVSVMGELVASLSHEITQPIASARIYARAAQNFLEVQPPDLGDVREALAGIVGNVGRAGDIIDRIRDQIRKAPPRKERFDLNAAIDEVIALGRNAIIKNRAWVQSRLSEGLFPVHGDRVQLQQVVLNLMLNALEAMGSVEAAPRELLISTRQDHTGVLVAVHDSASIRNISIAFSIPSTPQSPAEQGWGCRFAGQSLKPMAAGCGQRRMNLAVRYFSSPCLPRSPAGTRTLIPW